MVILATAGASPALSEPAPLSPWTLIRTKHRCGAGLSSGRGCRRPTAAPSIQAVRGSLRPLSRRPHTRRTQLDRSLGALSSGRVASRRVRPHENSPGRVPCPHRRVDGALTTQPRTPTVPPARSASASSMQSPPASAEATSVSILSPVFARPGAPPRSPDGRRVLAGPGAGRGWPTRQAGWPPGDCQRGCGYVGFVGTSIGCSHYPSSRSTL